MSCASVDRIGEREREREGERERIKQQPAAAIDRIWILTWVQLGSSR